MANQTRGGTVIHSDMSRYDYLGQRDKTVVSLNSSAILKHSQFTSLLNLLIEPTRGAEQRRRWRGGGVGRGRAAARIASAWVRAK
eukprot:4262419-Pleurochrysis_carterae.AAC.1